MKLMLSAVLGGVCVALGGVAFLSIENRVLGAMAFTVGLFTIVSRDYVLYTGRLCALWGKGGRAWGVLALIWLGNLLGTLAVAGVVLCTRLSPVLAERASALAAAKVGDGLLSLFLLGVLCNVLIYGAVEGYASCRYELGKYLSLFLGVMIFILCGFEHSVANMFYFALAGVLTSGQGLVALVVVSLGNLAGGLLISGADRVLAKK